MRFGIIVFPGSNCDQDCYFAIKDVIGEPVEYIWYKTKKLRKYDCIILPGGFSYGDYLRSGAIARFAPVIEDLKRFLKDGGIVIGICNGFQILLEAGFLPGAMLRNRNLQFICQWTYLRVERTDTPFTNQFKKGDILKIPIAHKDGNYYAPEKTLNEIEEKKQVLFRYCKPDGSLDENWNPNGSINSIAGIINERGNILGIMPHPERAVEDILGSKDGIGIFKSIINWKNT